MDIPLCVSFLYLLTCFHDARYESNMKRRDGRGINSQGTHSAGGGEEGKKERGAGREKREQGEAWRKEGEG